MCRPTFIEKFLYRYALFQICLFCVWEVAMLFIHDFHRVASFILQYDILYCFKALHHVIILGTMWCQVVKSPFKSSQRLRCGSEHEF